MPTIKRRINLTVSESLYAKIEAYKEEYGISSDAAACLQLITQQLKSLETSKAMMKIIQNSNMEQLMQMSREGLSLAKEIADTGALPDSKATENK